MKKPEQDLFLKISYCTNGYKSIVLDSKGEGLDLIIHVLMDFLAFHFLPFICFLVCGGGVAFITTLFIFKIIKKERKRRLVNQPSTHVQFKHLYK